MMKTVLSRGFPSPVWLVEREDVGLARSAGSDQSVGVDHRTLRAELSKLGIAQASVLAAQDHTDR